MTTQAYFEDIQHHIKHELSKAKSSIYIAVAWFTDNELFDILCHKAQNGLSIELMLMDDDINNGSGINYEKLAGKNAKVWKISTTNENSNLMHNKFCVIDGETVINGSYNWTNKAKQNHESITVIYEATDLARQFISEFSAIKEKYFGSDAGVLIIDYGKLCIRLETLKNVILLEDKEDIMFQLNKLKDKVSHLSDVKHLILLVEKQNYGEAVKLINEFVNRFTTLTVFIDSEIMALRLEIRALEIQISSLEDEKAEIEKLIHEFEIRYNNELGELIIKILRIKKEKLKHEAEHDEAKKQEYKEAEQDYNNFNENYKVTKDKKVNEITEAQKQELKANYRKASKLCHPDVVADEFKKQAEQIFKDLKDAYDSNDLDKVNEILSNLEKGIFTAKSEKVNEKDKLKAIALSLQLKRDELEITLHSIKSSETYKTISQLTDWNTYFKELKQKLETELNSLPDNE